MKVERKLIEDLWWFIENVSDQTPDRTERFFALRERVRNHYAGRVQRQCNRCEDRAAYAVEASDGEIEGLCAACATVVIRDDIGVLAGATGPVVSHVRARWVARGKRPA